MLKMKSYILIVTIYIILPMSLYNSVKTTSKSKGALLARIRKSCLCVEESSWTPAKWLDNFNKFFLPQIGQSLRFRGMMYSRLLYKCPARDFFCPGSPGNVQSVPGGLFVPCGIYFVPETLYGRGGCPREIHNRYMVLKRYIDYLQTKYLMESSTHRPPKPYVLDKNN
jgi:hypothetical protein